MEEQSFDNSKLHEYLTQHLDQFPNGDEELKIFKFSAGTSNPTFLLRKSGKEFVLRQKSPVTIYCGFHKVDIEYKIMSYLGTTEFPVPKMYLFCEDTSIMGQAFYVMEYIKGRQFPDANLPGVSADETKAIFHAAIKTLVQLQKENLEGLHLEGAGDGDNYLKYRLEMFEEGYKRVERKELPHAHRLMKWLKEHVPKDLKKAVIHHADFRISNMMLHPEKPEILAVIDWEGASWGHPFEDLAYFLFPFHFPAELECLPIKVGYHAEGIPSEKALLSLYCELTGESLPLPNWTFFIGLCFFRVLLNMQTVLSLFSGSDGEFPVAIQDIASMLEPFVEHACHFVGLN